MRTFRNTFAFLGGVAAVVTLALILGATGGFPSRPRFQAVGINQAAGTLGTLSSTVASGGSASFNSTNAGGSYLTFARSGTAIGDVGNGGQMGASFTIDALALSARTGNEVQIGANSLGPHVRISTGGKLRVMTGGGIFSLEPGTQDHAYMELFADTSNPTTRSGYFGFASGGTNTFSLTNEFSGGNVNIATTGTGVVTANAVAVQRQTVATTATSGSGMLVGDVLRIIKTGDTARSSTIVLSNDPDLQVTSLPAGRYFFEFYTQNHGTTTGTQGIGINVNYSGTFTSPASHWQSFRHCSGAVQTGGGVVAAAVTTLQQTCADLNTTEGDNALQLFGHLVSTGAGTLAVAWAQEASSANATNMTDGSNLTLTRLQ